MNMPCSPTSAPALPPSAARASRRRSLRRSIEALEARIAPAILFIDYGDRFSGGVLNTTAGAFRDIADDAVPGNKILGTALPNANAFNTGDSLQIQAQSFTALERAQMLDLVQRAYLPLDIQIVELTSSPVTLSDGRTVQAAANLTDVVSTLRGGDVNSKDAYIFVATFVVDQGGANQASYGSGGGGLSPDSPTLGVQSDLAAASNGHDDVGVVYSGGGFTNNTVNNIAHEAGHLLGLRHAITNAAATASINLYHQADIMSYRNTNNTTSSIAFSRLPVTRGDNNTPTTGVDPVNFDDIAPRNGQLTNYDQLRLDLNVGANPNFNFVSGSGLNDLITVTRSGGNAVVTVQPFTDTSFTTAFDMPGATGTSYNFSFALDKSILIYAGDSNDRIVLDGDLGVNIQIDGMLGTDSLVINGKGAANAVFAPQGNFVAGPDIVGGSLTNSFGGTISLGATSISFTDFETAGSVTFQGLDTFTYNTPLAGADNLTLSLVGGLPQISGTVNDGTALVPVSLQSVGRLAINTGLASDSLTVNSTNGLITLAGGIDFDGGGGFDRLTLTQAGGARTSSRIGVGSLPGSGQSNIDGQIVNFFNIEPVIDVVPAATLTIGTIPGLASLFQRANAVDYSASVLIAAGGRVTVDEFEPVEFSNKTTLVIDAGAGSDEVSIHHAGVPTALTGITVNAGDSTGSDTLIVSGTTGADSFTFTPTSLTAGAVNGVGVAVSYTGAEHLLLDGDAGDDTFLLDASTGDVTLKGGAGADRVDFSGSATGVIFHLDAVNLAQRLTSTDALVTVADRLENFSGSTSADILTVSASAFARDLFGDTPSLATGDKLIVDGQGAVVGLVKTDANTGVVKIKGFADVTFDEFESFTITNSPSGPGGFGNPGPNSGAFNTAHAYSLTHFVDGAGKPAPGRGPSSVAAADLNGDGFADLVSTNSATKSISVLMNKGDGTFFDAVNIPTGGTLPQDLVIGQFDAGAGLDVVVTNSGSTNLSLFSGNGAGGFAVPVLIPTQAQPWAIATDDLNADGNADVVVTHLGKKQVGVLLGTGAGLGAEALFGTVGLKPIDVGIGDFNNDGNLDVVTANNGSSNISFLAGNGAGALGAAVRFRVGVAPTGVAVGDFDADGRADVAVSHQVSRFVSILRSSALAAVPPFLPELRVVLPGFRAPTSIVAGDLDGDGVLDLGLSDSRGVNFTVLLGNGAASFTQPYEFNLGKFDSRPKIGGAALADLNGDGLLDIVTSITGNDDIRVLLRHT